MEQSGRAPWISGWTVEEPPYLGKSGLNVDVADWAVWPGSGLEGRDLGLATASGGALSAQHVRATGSAAGKGDWHCYDLDFELLAIIRGHLLLESGEGEQYELTSGSAFFHPGFYYHRDIGRSADFEAIYLTSPAAGERFDGRRGKLPARSATLAPDRTGVYTHDNPEEFEAGTGASPAFHRRDLGAGKPSGGRVRFTILRAKAAGAEDDLRRAHTSWIFGMDGTAALEIKGDSPQIIGAGDSVVLAPATNAHLRAAQSSFSALEMQYPTDPLSVI